MEKDRERERERRCVCVCVAVVASRFILHRTGAHHTEKARKQEMRASERASNRDIEEGKRGKAAK